MRSHRRPRLCRAAPEIEHVSDEIREARPLCARVQPSRLQGRASTGLCMRLNVMQVSACVTVMAAAVAGPIVLWKAWVPQLAPSAPVPAVSAVPTISPGDPALYPVSREPLETQDRYRAALAASADDRAWYIMGRDGCQRLKVAMGVDDPEHAVAALNADGGAFDYFKRTDTMVGIVQPLGPRFAFVRGYGACQVAWGVTVREAG